MKRFVKTIWTLTFLTSCLAQNDFNSFNLNSGMQSAYVPELNDESQVTSCTTEDNGTGECVSYYLCNENNNIITDGSTLIDIRFSGECNSYLDTCCKLRNKLTKPILPKLSSQPFYTDETNLSDKFQSTKGKCGIRNNNGAGFRIKGDIDSETQFGEFPWMVAILHVESILNDNSQKVNMYQCGGSLIHPKVVLTAAHCVAAISKSSGPIKLKARAGEWDTQTKKEILSYQDRNVLKIVKHEHYYSGGLFNDIALLFLESPMNLVENVGIICLPPKNIEPDLVKCIATGWGKDTYGRAGKYQVILKKVEMPIVDRTNCQRALRETRLGTHFELHHSFICAGGEKDIDTCKGDGGSPLVCPVPNLPGVYWQSGIVAWGVGCGKNGTPGVYVHVSYLREWIDEQLIYNSIDMTPYQL